MEPERNLQDLDRLADEPETRTILTTGASIGPYEIVSVLGEGGMGKVYRAVDNRLGRSVAIKISTQQLSKRFEREARAISALNPQHLHAV
jgi:serine/threonine protein kinase